MTMDGFVYTEQKRREQNTCDMGIGKLNAFQVNKGGSIERAHLDTLPTTPSARRTMQ